MPRIESSSSSERGDLPKMRNKSGTTRLGFALLLKFFEVEALFPESAKEVPAAA
ncbi:hypothetical protein [Streptomyces sp. NPDC055140]